MERIFLLVAFYLALIFPRRSIVSILFVYPQIRDLSNRVAALHPIDPALDVWIWHMACKV